MNGNGKFEKGKYVTIPETKNIKLPIAEERIRLGIRVKNEKGIEHPLETNYFVCPKEVRNVYGEEPTELTVFFPVADREKVFPQCYEKYGSNEALLCQGDGEKSAQRKNLENGRWEEVKCPCEHYNKKYDKETKIGGCVKAGYLRFMIPSVSIGTFYQCRVGGIVSIEECNSAFYLADKTTGGYWAMIPFRMRRVLKKITIPGTAKMKDHWVVTLEVSASVEEIRRVASGEILYLGQKRNGQYELEAPEPEEGKEGEEIITEETEEEIAAREALAEKKQEDLIKDIKESRDREADLKKAREAGKTSLKTLEEMKKIAEERKVKLEEIVKLAKENNVINWGEIVDIGERHNIFPKGLVASQVKTLIIDHPEKYNALIVAIEADQIIDEDDIPDDDEPGSSPDNAIPFKGKRKTIAKAEDFIAPGDMPD